MYCSHCAPCPQKIDVASVTKFLNLAKAQKEIPETVREHYGLLSHHAGECIRCGACETRCPLGFPLWRTCARRRSCSGNKTARAPGPPFCGRWRRAGVIREAPWKAPLPRARSAGPGTDPPQSPAPAFRPGAGPGPGNGQAQAVAPAAEGGIPLDKALHQLLRGKVQGGLGNIFDAQLDSLPPGLDIHKPGFPARRTCRRSRTGWRECARFFGRPSRHPAAPSGSWETSCSPLASRASANSPLACRTISPKSRRSGEAVSFPEVILAASSRVLGQRFSWRDFSESTCRYRASFSGRSFSFCIRRM